MVVPSPATLVAGVGLPAPELAGSSLIRMCSLAVALAGDPSLGGVVDGGSMSGAASDGSPCRRSSPASPAMSVAKRTVPALASGKLEDPRWGLRRGLRRGPSFGLMGVVFGAPEVLAGGSLPVEVFAFFDDLRTNGSGSLQRSNISKPNKTGDAEVKRCDRALTLLLLS